MKYLIVLSLLLPLTACANQKYKAGDCLLQDGFVSEVVDARDGFYFISVFRTPAFLSKFSIKEVDETASISKVRCPSK